VKQLDQKLAELENTLNQALESVRTLGVLGEDKAMEPSNEEFAAIPAELIQDFPQRIRDAAEMGNVSAIITFAEELKARSDACTPLSNRIAQLAVNESLILNLVGLCQSRDLFLHISYG
jgi:hypothetical protein